MKFDSKVLNFNLGRLGFSQTFSNSYQLSTKQYNVTLVFNGNIYSLTVNILYQSVKTVSKWTQILSPSFTYKVKEGINGSEVTLRTSGQGYRAFLELLEKLQEGL